MTTENKNPNPDERHPKSEPDSVEIAKPLPTPLPTDSDSDDLIDFGELDASGSKSYESGPLSGASVVSWTDLVKAQAGEQASFDFGGPDAIDFDSASDRDLLNRGKPRDVEDEASALLSDDDDDRPREKTAESIFAIPDDDDDSSSVFSSPQAGVQEKPAERKRPHDSDDHLELHTKPRDTEDTSAVDLGSMAVIDLPFPFEEGSSDRRLNAAAAESRPMPRPPVVSDSDIPSIEEHMAARSTVTPALSRPARTTSWIVGLAGGIVVGVGGCAAAWLAGFVPGSGSKNNTPVVTRPNPTPAADLTDGFALLQAGELDKALSALQGVEPTPAVRVAMGKARWLQYLRQCRQNQTAPSADGDEAKAAKEDFSQADSPEGVLWLGLMYESLGQTDAARKHYSDAKEKYKDQPEQARIFQAALDRLEARAGTPRNRAANRAIGMAMFVLLAEAGPVVPEEAGFRFWEALKLAKKHEYSAAQTALAAAKKAHDERRVLLAEQGSNPKSDPLEEIFLRSCDELAEYWALCAALHSGGYDLTRFANSESALKSLLNDATKDKAELKKLQIAAKTVNELLLQAKLDPADLAGSVRKLVQGKAAAESAAHKANEENQAVVAANEANAAQLTKSEAARKKVEADLAAAREQLASRPGTAPRPTDSPDVAKLRDENSRLGSQLASAQQSGEAARKTLDSLSAFVRSVRQKLQSPANADPSEVLNALDAVIAVKNQPRDLPPMPAGFYTIDPKGEQAYGHGLVELRAGRFAAAEDYFNSAVKHNDRDARYWYFLGLAKLCQGRNGEAELDFHQGAEREQRNLPNPSEVNRSLERWPVGVREVINRARARA